MASGTIPISSIFYAEYTAPSGTDIKDAFLYALQSIPANSGITLIRFNITDGESGTIIYNRAYRRAICQAGELYDCVINSSYTALAVCRKYTYTTI